MILSDWGQEDVEDHGEDDKDDVAHYTEPETWVFEELLVVGAEEDVTDGHPGDNPPEMGHEGDLAEGRSNKRGVSAAISLIKSSMDPLLLVSSDLMEMWETPKSLQNQFSSQNKLAGKNGDNRLRRGRGRRRE